jgi:short-subunit dehydrogenase
MSEATPVTLITGASTGIGAALADVFAAQGHALVLVARREAQLTALADAIERRGLQRPQVMAVDLTQVGATSRIADELRRRGLEPEIVVNSAGFGLMGQATTLDRAEQLAMIDLNVRVLTDLSLRFLDGITRRRGGILNVASVASFMPGPGMAVYHATKAYALSFSEALHRELAPQGVRVTVLCPGPVATEFQARAGIPEGYFPRILARSAERVAREGYEGLMQGRRVVITGTGNRITAFLPRLLPRGVMLWLVRASRRENGS